MWSQFHKLFFNLFDIDEVFEACGIVHLTLLISKNHFSFDAGVFGSDIFKGTQLGYVINEGTFLLALIAQDFNLICTDYFNTILINEVGNIYWEEEV